MIYCFLKRLNLLLNFFGVDLFSGWTFFQIHASHSNAEKLANFDNFKINMFLSKGCRELCDDHDDVINGGGKTKRIKREKYWRKKNNLNLLLAST